jgi:hypothetical protein
MPEATPEAVTEMSGSRPGGCLIWRLAKAAPEAHSGAGGRGHTLARHSRDQDCPRPEVTLIGTDEAAPEG